MSDPAEILKRRLEGILEGNQDSRGFHFFCQIGGTTEERGMITLQISGTGWTLLGWRKDDTQELYSVQFSTADQRKFYELIRSHPFWEAQPPRRQGHPEEINVHVRISDQNAGTWNGIQFWDTDMKDFPQVQDLMYRVHRIILAVSERDIITPLTFDTVT